MRHGFVKVAAATPDIRVADVGNKKKQGRPGRRCVWGDLYKKGIRRILSGRLVTSVSDCMWSKSKKRPKANRL